MNSLFRCFLLLSAFVLSLPANAQLGTTYNEGPVTEVTYLKIEYGHFDEYVDWLNSTWKPLKEQDAARIARSAYRKRLGTELIREVILK